MTLLIDNYDSFTYNLYDCAKQLKQEIFIIKNDEFSLDQIERINFTNIILSPGPRIPKEAGIMMDMIKKYYQTKPILGICLGHQAIGEFFGANLSKMMVPMHGKTSKIIHDNHFLFKSISNSFDAMRYHSLILDNCPNDFQVIAKTSSNEIMSIFHKTLPIAGVQFHPESILTLQGLKLLNNWFDYILALSSKRDSLEN